MRDRLGQVREGRLRKAAEVDDVGAAGGELAGADLDARDGKLRRLHDLGEDQGVVARQVAGRRALAEELRQVYQLLRAAHHRHAEARAERLEIAAAAAGHQDAVRTHRIGQPPFDHVRRHQRRHAHAELVHAPGERSRGHGFEHPRQALLGELSGQEQQVLALFRCHRLRAWSKTRTRQPRARATSAGRAPTALSRYARYPSSGRLPPPRRAARATPPRAGGELVVSSPRLSRGGWRRRRRGGVVSRLRAQDFCSTGRADARRAPPGAPPARRAGHRKSPPRSPAESSSGAACSPGRRDAETR